MNSATDAAVRSALVEHGVDDADCSRIASEILNSALHNHETGLQILSVNPANNNIVEFHIVGAMAAAAGVLAAAGAIVTGPVTIVAALAVIATLGALKGITECLPPASAQIIMFLYKGKVADRDLLKKEFMSLHKGNAGLIEAEFNRGLERLEHLGCVRTDHNEVRLVERVLIRWDG